MRKIELQWCASFTAAALAAALFLCSAWAGAMAGDLTHVPTDAEVAGAVRGLKAPSEADAVRARRHAGMPTDAQLSQVPAPGMPKVDALPAPANAPTVDLEALAKGYEAAGEQMAAAQAQLGGGPRMLVFVSFAMPEATLARLVEQAEKAPATLVLRGLTQFSLKATVLRVHKLIGNRKVAVQIDPQAFERFGVTKSPTFVLVRAGAQAKPCSKDQCLPASSFVSVAGDVSLQYALEFFQRNAPTFRDDAEPFVAKLGG